MPNHLIDLTGKTFGLLSVIRKGEKHIHSSGWDWKWICKCRCGNSFHVRGMHLRSGKSKSCGNKCRIAHPRRFYPSEYATWSAASQRCANPNNPRYSIYGGRGITMCDRWANSFTNFLNDVGERPSPKHSIDRINNDGNYEPGNVRWATIVQQANNRRGNISSELWVSDIDMPNVSRQARWRKRNLMLGLCGKCAKQKVAGKTLCPKCSVIQYETKKRHLARKRAEWQKYSTHPLGGK